ncbi:MAG: methyl-accepting chemotaxis protein, partial [Bdellovibrionales bacterium]|jgi:methyl-accepting chemotaxis protein|nr:methyl-accepting chemotaxis protein [Bdellovibrionales bacterium]
MFCIPGDAEGSEYSKFWPHLKAGNTVNGVFKRRTRDGKEVYLQAVFSPVKNEVGDVSKILKLFRDMPEQQVINEIQAIAVALSSAGVLLKETAAAMSMAASKTRLDSETAASAAADVSKGVQTVSMNMDEMVAAIKEIGRSTNDSAQMAKTTHKRVQESNTIISKLGVSSNEIGEVVKVISTIAQQTNLLALNATIEAARAGEAGKGFAVVANEVKELAKQTAKATGDITQRIGHIQSDTQEAVSTIGGISQAIEKLNELSVIVAAAVEEQTATTNEISRVVGRSQMAVDSIASSIQVLSETAGTSSDNSDHTLSAANELASLAEKLSALVDKVRVV